MSEHDWIENAGQEGLGFTSTHLQILEDLDISNETVREKFLQDVYYDEKMWMDNASKGGDSGYDFDSKVYIGTLDLLNEEEYLVVEFEGGLPSESQVFNGHRVSEWLPAHVHFEDKNNKLILAKTEFLGTTYFYENWIMFEAPNSHKKNDDDFNLDDFFGDLGEDLDS